MGNVWDDRLLGTGVAETQSARMQVVRNIAGDMIDVVVENADESVVSFSHSLYANPQDILHGS